MIEKTVFTNKIIIDVIKEKYNIDVYKIEKVNRGSANIYSLNGNKYILKEFQSKYTKDEIDKEISIINHLKENGICVPEYIQTVNYEYSFVYENRVIIMQKFIDGYVMESNTANFEQMLESAEYLGKIVKCLENINIDLPTNDIRDWYSKEALEEGIKKHKKLLQSISKKEYPEIYQDLNDKITMIEAVKNNVDFADIDKLTLMNTHGDYSLLQFIYKNGRIHSIIDFASACKMPIVWEIIRSYSYIDSNAKDGKINIYNLIQYVKKFTEYAPLNKYDLKYMSYLYLIQLLASTFGYKQYIHDNSNTSLLEFAFFRTKLSKFLYENTENISNALISELLDNN